MMLVELTTVPQEAIPLASFKDHLRLGSGFAEGDLQDAVIEGFLRAAMAAIEARTGKVLIERTFSWVLTGWREAGRQPLPLAPVSEVQHIIRVDRHGDETIAAETWTLAPDMQRPVISGSLPSIPSGGHVRLELRAGFGPNWSDIPADLAHACVMLAAHYYENRTEMVTSQQNFPFGVSALIEPYRT